MVPGMSVISVIMPCYNAEAYVAEALESVLSQSRPADEIIVVDDASTDRTLDILTTFRDRVTILCNADNRGPGYSRNKAIEASTGGVLAFLDADDVWETEHLETIMGLLDRYPEAGLAFSRMKYLGGSRKDTVFPHTSMCVDGPTPAAELLFRNVFVVPSMMAVRRSVHVSTRGFHDILQYYKGRRVQAEDHDYVLRLGLITSLVGSPDVTVRYRAPLWDDYYYSVAQIVMFFRYRAILLKELQEDPDMRNGRYEMLVERNARCWEENLEKAWRNRKTRNLRKMLSHGFVNPDLRRTSCRYLLRACVPATVARFTDEIRSK